jgi:hypothetical protein
MVDRRTVETFSFIVGWDVGEIPIVAPQKTRPEVLL